MAADAVDWWFGHLIHHDVAGSTGDTIVVVVATAGCRLIRNLFCIDKKEIQVKLLDTYLIMSSKRNSKARKKR